MTTKPFTVPDYLAHPERVIQRDGKKPQKIYCADAPGEYPIHGRIEGKSIKDTSCSWTEDGRYAKDGESDYDLLLIVPAALPALPDGREWHNPEKLTPQQIGEGYRMCAVGERMEGREGLEFRDAFGNWRESRMFGPDGTTYRLPASEPFLFLAAPTLSDAPLADLLAEIERRVEGRAK